MNLDYTASLYIAVEPWLVKYTMVDYKHSISVLRLVCGPNFFGTKPAPKFGLVLR